MMSAGLAATASLAPKNLFAAGGSLIDNFRAEGEQARIQIQNLRANIIVAAKPGGIYDVKYGGFLMKPADFTGLVYAGV
jgi:hypothetical protein